MIRKLEIQGYRSLDGLSLDNLGRVNLIVGTGGSGKTNLLEAAFLFCSNGNAGLLVTVSGLRGLLGQKTPMREFCSLLDWFWTVPPQPGHEFSLSGLWNEATRQVTVTRRGGSSHMFDFGVEQPDAWSHSGESKAREPLAFYEIVSKQDGEVFKGTMVIGPGEPEVSPPPGPRIPAVFVSARERGHSYDLSSVWTKVEDAGESSRVVELLQMLDPEIEDVRISADSAGKAYLRVQHTRLGRVPLEILGGGLGKALSLAARIMDAQGGVMLIDEFDSSIHVGAQAQLIKFILEAARRHDTQLFISTHSIETIDAFLDNYESTALWSSPSDFQILQTRQASGRSEVKSFDSSEVKVLRENLGLDLRQPA